MNSDYMKRHCLWCNLVLIQRKGEAEKLFNKRKYCGTKCRRDYNNWQAKVKGTR